MAVEDPPLEVAEDLPEITGTEFEARIGALRAAVDADWIVVYGDREHAASLIFLCNLDPRFEEALLVLGPRRRTLILGKEDVGYVPVVPIDVEVVCCPTFSLMGIDRGGGPTLEDALRETGIGAGARIGIVGWKALNADEWNGRRPAIFAPAFVVDTLRDLAGESGTVADATPALTSSRSGLRTFASADQIAVFEWGAARCSAWVHAIIGAARPGVSEHEAFRAADWSGEPLSLHPVFSSGPDIAVGLRSPSSRRLELGDAAVACIGLWGGNCARGGLVAASSADLTAASDGYLERLVVPYWRAMTTWYETLAIGIAGGEVFDTVTELLASEEFGSSLNPGHLLHYEEWMNSPIRSGSDDPIASGMVLQSDIIPTGIRPGWTVNCEDTIVIADDALREELAAQHPELWSRVRARQEYVRGTLGVALRDEVLPLSCTAAYFRPFWLASSEALAFT
ncbi:MAG: M24 family metallopeptidase [Solirubrobacteraceae bacterium]